MSAVVVDASLFVSALSPAETHHQAARRLLAEHPKEEPLRVPALFRLEVLSALARRGRPAPLLETVDAIVNAAPFLTVPVSGELIERAVSVARTAGLRAYDAIYVALALEIDATLWTLDREIRSKSPLAFPDLRIAPV